MRDSTVGAAKSLAAACMGIAAGGGGRPDWLQLKDASAAAAASKRLWLRLFLPPAKLAGP